MHPATNNLSMNQPLSYIRTVKLRLLIYGLLSGSALGTLSLWYMANRPVPASDVVEAGYTPPLLTTSQAGFLNRGRIATFRSESGYVFEDELRPPSEECPVHHEKLRLE